MENSNNQNEITYVDFLSFKGTRRCFINIKEAINKNTGLPEQWQELCLGDSPDNGEIVRISSKMETVSGAFLKENAHQLQVAKCADWKFPRLCRKNTIKSVSTEEIVF